MQQARATDQRVAHVHTSRLQLIEGDRVFTEQPPSFPVVRLARAVPLLRRKAAIVRCEKPQAESPPWPVDGDGAEVVLMERGPYTEGVDLTRRALGQPKGVRERGGRDDEAAYTRSVEPFGVYLVAL